MSVTRSAQHLFSLPPAPFMARLSCPDGFSAFRQREADLPGAKAMFFPLKAGKTPCLPL